MPRMDTETRRYRSQLANYYFNEQKPKKSMNEEVPGVYIISKVIENLFMKGIREIPRKDLIKKVIAADPNRADFLERRIKKMITFAKNPGDKCPVPLLEEEDGIITIIPADNDDND